MGMFQTISQKHTRLTIKTMYLMLVGFYTGSYTLLSYSSLGKLFSISKLLKGCTVLTILSLILLFAFVLRFRKIKPTMMIGMVLLVGLIAAIELYNSNINLIVMVLFLVIAPFINLSIDELIRFDIKLKFLWLLIIVGLCFIGFLPNVTGYYNGVYKISLGFGQPNVTSFYMCMILCELMVACFKKLKFYSFLWIFFALLIIMQISTARTTIYSFAVIIVLFGIAKIIPRLFQNKLIHLIMVISAPGFACLTYVLTQMYIKKEQFAVFLDRLLSSRLSYQAFYLQYFRISLLGQKGAGDRIDRYVLDNAYFRFLLIYGVILFVCFVVAYMLLMHICLKRNRTELALFVLFIVVTAIGERYALDIAMNISLICLISPKMIPEKRIELEEKKVRLRLKTGKKAKLRLKLRLN